MTPLTLTILLVLARAYIVVALVVAVVFSPPLYGAVPLLTLLLYLYMELWGKLERHRTALNLYLALSLPLLLQPVWGQWLSAVFALPVIPLLDLGLRRSALAYEFVPAVRNRRPTAVCRSLVLSLLAVGVVALALGSRTLFLGFSLVAGYLAAVILAILRGVPASPCQVEIANHKVLAGDLARTTITLTNRSRLAGQLKLVSPYHWFHIRPDRVAMSRSKSQVEAAFTPPLAGPSAVVADAIFVDPWGLIQTNFRVEMLALFVVPRAAYAGWLARRYLEMSRPGEREAMTAAMSVSQRPSRKGMELYGLRQYQPGDSARSIDWKHTLKLRQTIVKEFQDTGVECAVMTVNLSVADEEEKDKLAYSFITTALTLARENVPSAMAAYNDREVVLTTRLLEPRQALLKALHLAREITVSPSPIRYLEVPDVSRLRGNIHRLRQSSQGAATALADLLELEYNALAGSAERNPAAAALNATLSGLRARANVLVLSGRNHDAEALAFQGYALQKKDYRVIAVELGKSSRGVKATRDGAPYSPALSL